MHSKRFSESIMTGEWSLLYVPGKLGEAQTGQIALFRLVNRLIYLITGSGEYR